MSTAPVHPGTKSGVDRAPRPEEVPQGPQPVRSNRLLVLAVIASQAAPPFMFSGVAVALPTLGAALGAGATELGLVETLFLASGMAFLLPAGRLADAGDKRTLYKLGLAGFGVTSMLIGCSSSMMVIVGLRFLQGLASAAVSATGPAILADLVPPARRGRAYGGALGAIYAGLTLGPICAGLLVDLWGWRAVFAAGGGVLLLGLLLVHRIMPSTWRWRPGEVDLASTVLVVCSVLCVVAASALIRHLEVALGLMLAGLCLAAAFLVLQRRLRRPLLDLDALMQNRVLRSALLVQMLLYMNAYSSTFMLSLFMQVSLGRLASTSGQVLAIGTVLMALTAPMAGRLADRFPPRAISTLGVACVLAAGSLALSFDQGSHLVLVTVMLAIQGVGFALFSSPNMTIIMNSVAPGAVSMASALSAKLRSLGMVSGMLVTAVLISLGIGNDPVSRHPDRFVEIMGATFTILVGVAACALMVSVVSMRRQAPGSGR